MSSYVSEIDIRKAAFQSHIAWLALRGLCIVMAVASGWLCLRELVGLGMSHTGPTAYFVPSATLAVMFALVSSVIGTYHWRSAALATIVSYLIYAFLVSMIGYEFGTSISLANDISGVWSTIWSLFSNVNLVGVLLFPFVFLLVFLCFGFLASRESRAPLDVVAVRKKFGSRGLSWPHQLGHPELFAIVFGIGVASPGVLAAMLNALEKAPISDQFRAVVLILPMIALALVLTMAHVLFRLLQRIARRSAERALARDARPPILLLRSFRDDDAKLRPSSLLSLALNRRLRLEEVIGFELQRIGPFIAVGMPGENLPLLGAHRAYFADNEWQEKVVAWMERSAVAILVAGLTSWVQWELGQIRDRRSLDRLVVLFPPCDAPEMTARWQIVCKSLDGIAGCEGLMKTRSADVLALFLRRDGRPVVVRGSRRTQCDYELALFAALDGMAAPRVAARDAAGNLSRRGAVLSVLLGLAGGSCAGIGLLYANLALADAVKTSASSGITYQTLGYLQYLAKFSIVGNEPHAIVPLVIVSAICLLAAEVRFRGRSIFDWHDVGVASFALAIGLWLSGAAIVVALYLLNDRAPLGYGSLLVPLALAAIAIGIFWKGLARRLQP